LPQQQLGGGGVYLGAFGLEDYDAGDGAGEASEAGGRDATAHGRESERRSVSRRRARHKQEKLPP
jgi:hypothetical protein